MKPFGLILLFFVSSVSCAWSTTKFTIDTIAVALADRHPFVSDSTLDYDVSVGMHCNVTCHSFTSDSISFTNKVEVCVSIQNPDAKVIKKKWTKNNWLAVEWVKNEFDGVRYRLKNCAFVFDELDDEPVSHQQTPTGFVFTYRHSQLTYMELSDKILFDFDFSFDETPAWVTPVKSGQF